MDAFATAAPAIMLPAPRLATWAASAAFPRMCEQIFDFTSRLATYLDGQGRKDHLTLAPAERWHYAAANMRATDRTLSLANCYLGARDNNYPNGLLMREPKPEKNANRLPPAFAALLAELDGYEVRTWRLLQCPAGSMAGAVAPNVVVLAPRQSLRVV